MPPRPFQHLCALVSAGLCVLVATAVPAAAHVLPAAEPARPAAPAVLPPAPGEASVVVTLPSRSPGRIAALAAQGAHDVESRRAEVAALAPPAAARDAVRRFAARAGFTVGATSTYGMELRGGRDALAAAFGATIVAGPGGYHPAADLRLPDELAAVGASATGLDTRPLFRPRAVPGGFANGSLRAAYQYSPVKAGEGITVATVQFARYDPMDYETYAAAAGITLAPGQITGVPVQGAALTASPGDFEDTIDIQAVLATAPAAFQRVYVADQAVGGAGIALYSQIADDVVAGKVQVVSTSWGVCESMLSSSYTSSMDSILQRIAAAGGTVFAASGDAGAYDCSLPGAPNATVGVDYPAASPYVVGVGGTRLTGDSSGYAEVGWSSPRAAGSPATTYQGNASGGGESARQPRPSYQAGLAVAGSRRLVPDISSLGDASAGIGVYHAPEGWLLGGGTSVSAPLEAGLLAAAMSSAGRTAGVGDIHPALYQHPAAFRDVTSGTNYIYTAGPGFDQVTGLGSPLWDSLGPFLVPGYATTTSPPPSASPSASPTAAGSPAPSATATPSVSPSATPSPSAVPDVAPTVFPEQSVISAGQRVTVQYQGQPGGVLTILSKTQPATAYSVIGSLTLDASGLGAASYAPTKNTRLQASTASGLSSGQPLIQVRSVASINAFRVGPRTYTFTGRVYPARSQRVVSVYRDGVLVAQGRCDANGIYSIRRTLAGGTFTFQARTGNDTYNLGATSRSVRVLIS